MTDSCPFVSDDVIRYVMMTSSSSSSSRCAAYEATLAVVVFLLPVCVSDRVQLCVDRMLVGGRVSSCPSPCWCPHADPGTVRCDSLNLATLPPSVWNELPTSVNLSANRLAVWPPASSDGDDVIETAGLACVRTLLLADNGLSHIRPGTLGRMRELRHLALDGNAIAALDNGTFVGLEQLELLDLSRNRIGVLPELVFRDLVELKVSPRVVLSYRTGRSAI